MIIYPAMDLFEGEVVRLYKGDFQKKTVYAKNPFDLLDDWQQKGVRQVHLVDLGGSRGDKRSGDLIARILARYSINFQVAGGVRTEEHLARLLDEGAHRVVVGSHAASHSDQVIQWLDKYSSKRLTIACDVIHCDGKWVVCVQGWTQRSDLTLHELISRFSSYAELVFLITDIAKDGTLTRINKGLYEHISDRYPEISYLISGGVKDTEDLEAGRQLGAYGCIVGKSLYEGGLSLEDLGC